jgi:hypothetical protein
MSIRIKGKRLMDVSEQDVQPGATRHQEVRDVLERNENQKTVVREEIGNFLFIE